MKISAIICSYNQGRYLKEAIVSVINQTYADKELIVIDGGSTDESVAIIKKYESDIDYWVSEKDNGQTNAINKGISKATGDIVGWLNSDDIYMKGCFDKVMRVFQSSKHPNVVHGGRLLIDAETRLLGWSCKGAFKPEKYRYNICSETAFWKREFNEQGQFLNEDLSFAMDLEWFSRLYVAYGNFCYVNTFLGAFRCHEENKSSTLLHVKEVEGPREWKRLFGRDMPTNGRFSIEFYLALAQPTLTLFPTILKRCFAKRKSIKPTLKLK